jgi:serine phosphatase RsbU (regulator of sigma subunit)
MVVRLKISSFIENGRFLILLWMMIFTSTEGYTQTSVHADSAEQEQISVSYEDARGLFEAGNYQEALPIAEQLLEEAMSQEEKKTETEILIFIGDIYQGLGEPANGLPYYLRAAGVFEAVKDTVQLINVYRKIATAYRAEEVHSKEQEYFERILDVLPESFPDERLEVRTRIGSAAFLGKDYDEAASVFRSLIPEYSQGETRSLYLHNELITVFAAAGQYDSALYYSERLISEYEKREMRQQAMRLIHNIAYYYTMLNDYPEASSYYLSAIQEAEELKVPLKEIGFMKSNAGVCFANMGREKEAIKLFNEAIDIFNKEKVPEEMSRNENMLANLYYATKDLYNAGLFCRRAIKSAVEASEPWAEAEAYFTYSKVLRDGNDPVNALNYYEKYLEIRDSIEFSRQMKIQALNSKKYLLEQQERELRLRLKEDELSALAIQQLRLQNERTEQEKALLLQERNLDMLKQDSLRQSMIIKDQQYLVSRQERENRLLEQEKQLSDLKLSEEVAKQQALERQTQVLEQQQRLDQLELERQKTGKQVLIGTVIGVGLLMLFAVGSLISTRRKNHLLALQKREIEEKNIDLEQKNDEISAQRDEIEAQRNLVYDQKQAIEAYNDEIMKSIEYAKRLQAAALPPLSELKEKVVDQFILFRPRDVVSGDFYWFAEVEGKLVVTVADCTGHGVPGAFMSMMGMSLLKELVQKEYITHPGVILRRMRKEIIDAMGQKGISGEQRDGMDMALISYDPEERKIDYAGAYNSLYLVRDKQLPGPEIEGSSLPPDQESEEFYLYEIPADKMPIAHFDRMVKFRNHEITIHPGDTVYLFTDGFADQFGGVKGKKFMYKPFKRLLLKHADKPLQEQHTILSEILDKWMGNISQVDDICVMGVRF